MKKPFVTKEQLDEITARFPTPFYLYDEMGIRNHVRNLHRAFSWNRGFTEYFAVKATPNPAILRILKEEGCGVDCSSLTELMLARQVGFSGRQIMFSSNATPQEEFAAARQLGALINLDDITHISCLERCGVLPKTVSLRYNPGGDFFILSQIMDTPRDAKYGLTRPQLLEAVQTLQKKGVEQFGLHAFLASNSLNADYYPALAKLLLETILWLRGETGAQFGFVNLSGGLGIPYKPGDMPLDIGQVSRGVRAAFEFALTGSGAGEMRLYTELGRYMLGPYGCLVATAVHRKEIYKRYIGLDACAVNLMRPAMYGAYHHITISGKEHLPPTEMYDITGSLCENNDKFAVDRYLPEVEIGDRFIIHDTGAHGFAMGYNYNGRLRSAELLLKENGDVELIRRAETPDDYFATLRF